MIGCDDIKAPDTCFNFHHNSPNPKHKHSGLISRVTGLLKSNSLKLILHHVYGHQGVRKLQLFSQANTNECRDGHSHKN